MKDLVTSADLFVMQVEMDVYNLLKRVSHRGVTFSHAANPLQRPSYRAYHNLCCSGSFYNSCHRGDWGINQDSPEPRRHISNI